MYPIRAVFQQHVRKQTLHCLEMRHFTIERPWQILASIALHSNSTPVCAHMFVCVSKSISVPEQGMPRWWAMTARYLPVALPPSSMGDRRVRRVAQIVVLVAILVRSSRLEPMVVALGALADVASPVSSSSWCSWP